MTLTFLATGEPTPDAEYGRAHVTDTGLMKAGRRQIRTACGYLGKPAWVITTYEPDARESALHALGRDFASNTHFLPSLSAGSPHFRQAPTELWYTLQGERFADHKDDGFIVVRPCQMPRLIIAFTSNFPNARKIREKIASRHFEYGQAVRIRGGNRPQIKFFL